ncbi:hypothetical protein AVEN_162991-1 [Araneus ventricosus]|uniref:Uncharacterized protein n=1 Tax=Araneus ventricosus TaxID=182803 RepID=A0A4Y2BZ98_ARAVE|nr:hypothetical protein AVEN_162991-1 [Araneus ventricosus]
MNNDRKAIKIWVLSSSSALNQLIQKLAALIDCYGLAGCWRLFRFSSKLKTHVGYFPPEYLSGRQGAPIFWSQVRLLPQVLSSARRSLLPIEDSTPALLYESCISLHTKSSGVKTPPTYYGNQRYIFFSKMNWLIMKIKNNNNNSWWELEKEKRMLSSKIFTFVNRLFQKF